MWLFCFPVHRDYLLFNYIVCLVTWGVTNLHREGFSPFPVSDVTRQCWAQVGGIILHAPTPFTQPSHVDGRERVGPLLPPITKSREGLDSCLFLGNGSSVRTGKQLKARRRMLRRRRTPTRRKMLTRRRRMPTKMRRTLTRRR